MRRTMLGGKIHRATVTEANVDYEGSITVDRDLLDAAGILPNEVVHVWDATNGSRLTTYAIPGERGSSVVCANGAAANLVDIGDLVIIAAFVELEDHEAREWQPSIVFVDGQNRMVDLRAEVAGRV